MHLVRKPGRNRCFVPRYWLVDSFSNPSLSICGISGPHLDAVDTVVCRRRPGSYTQTYHHRVSTVYSTLFAETFPCECVFSLGLRPTR